MGKDPAFLFYPGDYLRDTQCLSESVQVAYDRIMCEHMRNICISYDRLNFFTKRLTDSQKEELMSVLVPIESGYAIDWVRISVINRRNYSEGRSKNRRKKHYEDMKTHDEDMKTHDEDMEIEIEIKDKDFKTTKTTLIAPTLEEVCWYIKDKGSKIDPIAFHAHYEANGWMRGKNKIKSWKACVTTWEQRNKEFLPSKETKPAYIRPPVYSVVLVGIASKWEDRMIKTHCIEKGYSEYESDEAIMRARGTIK